uniref:Uncharacterized protein n=1 Tax=Talaromyces marneffei PM1 TaxID=1077442 RepID=A0A093V466_TALMA
MCGVLSNWLGTADEKEDGRQSSSDEGQNAPVKLCYIDGSFHELSSACCAVRQTATPFRQRSLSVHSIAEIPEPNDVFRWLRATLSSISDARDYVDTAFDDLEKVRKNDQDFDKIVKEIFDLVGDGASDSLQTHPGVKEPVGSSYDQLKQMGDGYVPKQRMEWKENSKDLWGLVKKVPSGKMEDVVLRRMVIV